MYFTKRMRPWQLAMSGFLFSLILMGLGQSSSVYAANNAADLGAYALQETTKTILGTVTYDSDDSPVTPATVRAFNAETEQEYFADVAEDGTFEILVEGGFWELSVDLSALSPELTALNEAIEIEFQLDDTVETFETADFRVGTLDAVRSKTIRGTVTYVSDGSPVTSAIAIALEIVDDTASTIVTGQEYFADVAEDGTFEIQVTGGVWSVYISPVESPPAWTVSLPILAEFDLDDTVETFESAIFSAYHLDGVLTGQIVDPSGNPLAFTPTDETGLNYGVRFFAEDLTRWHLAESYVDEDGRFSIPVILGGLYDLLIELDPELYPQFMGDLLVNQTPINSDAVDLGIIKVVDVNRPKRIVGRVFYDSDGSPVTTARVVASNEESGNVYTTETAEDGTFEIHVESGFWKVSLESLENAPDWLSTDYFTIEYASNDTLEISDSLDFEVRFLDIMLTGQIKDPDGNPLPYEGTDLNPGASFDILDANTGHIAYGFVDQNGTFSIPVLDGGHYAGVLWLDAEQYPQFSGYPFEYLIAVYDDSLDLGELKVLANNATISGNVKNTDDTPAQGAFVDAFQEDGLVLSTETDADGNYELKIPAGEWQVQPYPVDSVFAGQPTELTLGANATEQASFDVEPLIGEITGTLVDEQNQIVTNVDAFAYVRLSDNLDPFLFTPVEAGQFTARIPAGTLKVGLDIGFDSLYDLPEEAEVTSAIGSASPQPVTLQLVAANARISGRVVDGEGNAVTGVSGVVYAIEQERPEHWKLGEINSDDGSYSIPVTGGTWELFYELEQPTNNEPTSEHPRYAVPERSTVVTVGANATATQNLEVIVLDGVIHGIAVDDNDNPIPNALVWIRVGDYEADTHADQEGHFTFYAPKAASAEAGQTAETQVTIGTYAQPSSHTVNCTDPLPDTFDNYQASESLNETLDALGTAPTRATDDEDEIDRPRRKVKMKKAKAHVRGSVHHSNPRMETLVAGAVVSGVNLEDGQTFTVKVDADGCYVAPVNADEAYKWKITVKHTDNNNNILENSLTITSGINSSSDQNGNIAPLVLQDSGVTMPKAETHAFKLETGWHIELTDGFSVTIPSKVVHEHNNSSRAVKMERAHDLRVTVAPDTEVHDTYLYTVIGYGYDVFVKDNNKDVPKFDNDVRIRLPYSNTQTTSQGELMVGQWLNHQWIVQKLVIQHDNYFAVSIKKPGTYAILRATGAASGAGNQPTDLLPEAEPMLGNHLFVPVVLK